MHRCLWWEKKRGLCGWERDLKGGGRKEDDGRKKKEKSTFHSYVKHIHWCICLCVHIHACTHIHVHMHMYIYTCTHCINKYVLEPIYIQTCTHIHIDILTCKIWNQKEDYVEEGSGLLGGQRTRGGLWEWIWAHSSDKNDENSIINPLFPMLTKILIKNLTTQLCYKMFQFKLKLAWVFSKILAKKSCIFCLDLPHCPLA